MPITNAKLRDHDFLAGMFRDDYFPNDCVEKCKQVLVSLCEEIEAQQPASPEAVLALTHAATRRINALENDFEAAGSELETEARESLAGDFVAILEGYGFGDVDIEEAIAPRTW